MKGPFERLKYDLRRVWECPLCHHRERSNGGTVMLYCHCRAKENGASTAMKLIEDGVRRVLAAPQPARETKRASASSG